MTIEKLTRKRVEAWRASAAAAMALSEKTGQDVTDSPLTWCVLLADELLSRWQDGFCSWCACWPCECEREHSARSTLIRCACGVSHVAAHKPGSVVCADCKTICVEGGA